MSDEPKVTMILCADLEPAEQEKIERLDGPIFEAFSRAGHAVRICQSRVDGEGRELDFVGPGGTVASVDSREFIDATDAEAVSLITAAI